MSTTSNADILLIAKTDKHRAFKFIFDNFWERLYLQAYRKIRDENTAKDIVQDVFLVLWNNFDTLKEANALEPYLYAVLRNKILKLFEKDEVRLRYMFNSIVSAKENFEPSSHQLLLTKELKAIIDLEVEKMPPRMKEIYVLKKDQEFSIKEIAQKLNLSEQSVKNQLSSAYRRLKEGLKQYGTSVYITFLFSFLLS